MRTAHQPRRTTGRLTAALLLSLAPLNPAIAGDSSPEVVVTAQTRPNLFGTVVLPGPPGRWTDKWQKVASDPDSAPALKSLVAPARGLGRLDQLRFVQAEIDRKIGWRSDGTQYGARIYWASAAETLESGFGDDDDRAILKYQALRSLGFPRSDYYLVMGRDKVRGEYVMLAARAEGRWWLLEEQGDAPVPADGRRGFEPVASFGAGKSWIHGRPRQLAVARSAAPAATSSAAGVQP